METPLTHAPLTWLKKRWQRMRKAWELNPHIDDLHAAFEDREGAALTRHERELLENALAFSQVTADDVSVPRAEIVSVAESSDFPSVLRTFVDSSHTRLPVHGKNLDDIKGFVMLKDFIPFVGREASFSLAAITRPVAFVPENMSLPRVLQIMRKNHAPMVLAVDEFGGTSGLISLHDILEELVGDIEDEHGPADEAPMVSIGSGRYRVQGDFTLEDLDAALGTTLALAFEDHAETLAGALMQTARKVPAKGEKIILHPNVEAMVTASDGRRVLMVEIHVRQP